MNKSKTNNQAVAEEAKKQRILVLLNKIDKRLEKLEKIENKLQVQLTGLEDKQKIKAVLRKITKK